MAERPLSLGLLDVEGFIRSHNCGKVSSTFIRESSSTEFALNGLFSEAIFGQLGSTDRLIKFGYIDLKTTVFHPIVYSNLVSLKALYGEIMAKKTYAKFDPTEKDFVRSDENDEDADTGYKFFMDHYKQIVFQKNDSLSRNEKIDQVTKAGSLAFWKSCLVLPAQMRDVDPTSARLEPDSINKLYVSLINYANAMPPNGDASALYDGIRFSIQKKVAELYEYIFGMVEGKYGYFQHKYGCRNLALGTRNVISPAPLSAGSPDSGQQLKVDELGFPLFQCLKAAMPLVIYNAKEHFFNLIFNPSSDQVALIDPNTFDLVYKSITEDEKTRFISSEGIEKLVNLFKDREFRFRPMTCKTDDDKYYYLFLVYDEGTRLSIVRSINSIKEQLSKRHEVFDPIKLRPITYAEFFYIVGYLATKDKHCTITRYPAQEIGSTVPCSIHLLSTNPSRSVLIEIGSNGWMVEFPEYPVLDKGFQDSVAVHANIEPGLNADHDGDTVSVSVLFSDEANQECEKHNNSVSRWFSTSGKMAAGLLYLEPMPIWNLTRDPS